MKNLGRFVRHTLVVASMAPIALLSPLAAQKPTEKPADNTAANKTAGQKPAADQQKMNKGDSEITRQIRKAIVADKSLSTYAHNVKVITVDGNVTLKGPVRSDQEKEAIETLAKQFAGDGKVTSEITIAPPK